MKLTRKQVIAFLVEHMRYNKADLIGLTYEELTDGLNMNMVEAYIS